MTVAVRALIAATLLSLAVIAGPAIWQAITDHRIDRAQHRHPTTRTRP